ncbi:hypothetical protein ASC95_09355 [Pelomonas sp. Root1217]|nr:hypothetical protein ASC95_09355 [Pelomonas sp. Root1217]
MGTLQVLPVQAFMLVNTPRGLPSRLAATLAMLRGELARTFNRVNVLSDEPGPEPGDRVPALREISEFATSTLRRISETLPATSSHAVTRCDPLATFVESQDTEAPEAIRA